MRQKMPSRKWQFRIQDIIESIEKIEHYLKEINLATFQNDSMIFDAVIRNFEIIGEALSRIGRIDEDALKSIRDYRSIRSFRNLLVHAYDHIEDAIVWGIIENDIDHLIEDIGGMK